MKFLLQNQVIILFELRKCLPSASGNHSFINIEERRIIVRTHAYLSHNKVVIQLLKMTVQRKEFVIQY